MHICTFTSSQVNQIQSSNRDISSASRAPAFNNNPESAYPLHAMRPRAPLIKISAGNILMLISHNKQSIDLIETGADFFSNT